MEKKIEIVLEGVLKVRVDGQVVAMLDNDMEKRSQIFYATKEMGAEDVKNLLESISQKNAII